MADDFVLLAGSASRRLGQGHRRLPRHPLGQSETKQFSDGNLFVRVLENVRGRDVFLVQGTAFPVNELLFWIDALKRGPRVDGHCRHPLRRHMRYHMAMARRQVLVQLDDDLVERLDEIAAKRNVSRSQLLRDGGWAVVHLERVRDADARLREGYLRYPQEPDLMESLDRIAAETMPEW